MTDMLYTIDEIKKRLTPIFEEYMISKAAVFGSYAQNKAKADSDVDLLISSEDVFDLDAYCEFEEKIEKILDKNVDIVFYDYINPYMRTNILREAVSIYG